jgi:hypothetical protein
VVGTATRLARLLLFFPLACFVTAPMLLLRLLQVGLVLLPLLVASIMVVTMSWTLEAVWQRSWDLTASSLITTPHLLPAVLAPLSSKARLVRLRLVVPLVVLVVTLSAPLPPRLEDLLAPRRLPLPLARARKGESGRRKPLPLHCYSSISSLTLLSALFSLFLDFLRAAPVPQASPARAL